MNMYTAKDAEEVINQYIGVKVGAKIVRKVEDKVDYNVAIMNGYYDLEICEITKTIVLPLEEYNEFIIRFLEDSDIIKNNLSQMYIRDGVWYCIAITAEEVNEVVLIESEGYDYARYVAVVNKKDLK